MLDRKWLMTFDRALGCGGANDRPSDLRVPGPEEAVDAERDQPQSHDRQKNRTDRCVLHGAQGTVQTAGLDRVVADSRPTEQPADNDERNALGDVAGLAEADDLGADAAGEIVGELQIAIANRRTTGSAGSTPPGSPPAGSGPPCGSSPATSTRTGPKPSMRNCPGTPPCSVRCGTGRCNAPGSPR